MKLPNVNLYTRFFLLFTVTTIALVLLVVLASFSMSESEAENVVAERHEALHEMMVALISGPIDIDHIKKEAKKNRVSIEIKRGSEVWRTGNALPNWNELMNNATPHGDLFFTNVGFKYFVFTQSDDTTIAVTSQIANLIVYPNWLVYWPWLGLMGVLFLSYRILNAQLSPIQNAIDSATQISQGNLKYRIKKHPKNDLGQLTQGLNMMAENLEELFASKNELLLSVSHELRSPMARMKVLLALLDKDEPVAKLNDEINKMNAIVEQLLESERLKDSHKILKLETYFFPNVLNDILKEFDHCSNLSLEGIIPELVINIDLGRFQFLVRNLIDNALKHSTPSSPVLIICKKEQNQLFLSVRDFGTGIDEAFLDRVFEPFSQASDISNRSHNGVGLGLFLCKRIALAHGGDLIVKSDVGKGSDFTFKLPLAIDAV